MEKNISFGKRSSKLFAPAHLKGITGGWKSELKIKVSFILKFCFATAIICFNKIDALAQTTSTLTPIEDAYVRNGSYGNTNYGGDTSLAAKSSVSTGFTRSSYLKFSLSSITIVTSAKLRLYGYNTSGSTSVPLSMYGVDNDLWNESGITFNNAPAIPASSLGSVGINDQQQYYELDVTNFVKAQFGGDNIVSFAIKDAGTANQLLSFNSKENLQNQPQLVITSTVAVQSNALLFVENPDKFPSNNDFVFSRIQTPWSRDKVHYNSNHDSLRLRIRNNGINPLIISALNLSNNTTFKIEKFNGASYVPGAGLPYSVISGGVVDLILRFIAVNQASRVKILNETLTIVSNDDINPSKIIFLHGLWQKLGEGSNEPYASEIISAFGFKTSTGFGHTDPDLGDSTKLKGSEIKPSYFVRADPAFPISVRQMSAYHGCCTATETLVWYVKGSSTFSSILTHTASDGQSVLPRKNTTLALGSGSFNTASAFGFRIGAVDFTDANKNPGKKIGVRVWKAIDANNNIIPNSYLISNDYLGSTSTNYDYNDNTYFISNIKPEIGTAFFSSLGVNPSAVDFGEKVLQTNNTLQLDINSLGKTYSNGTQDPLLTISSVVVTGENKSEFFAAMPVKTTLNPQEATTIAITFNPASQGLKIADLLIYYNNSTSPKRVPLYGIAKASNVTVTANFRINSGSSNPITINGKTWSKDQFAFDNLEPYTNPALFQISATDEDALYLDEQSSNGDKKPFRYEITVPNGDYVVRLHFAEIYWGAPGSGLSGGEGSRVMSVKLENQLRLINFDVTHEVGGASAIIKNFPVTVTDGKLNIDFSATANRPMVCALEVYSFSTPAARIAKADSASSIISSVSGADQNNFNLRALHNLQNPKLYPNPLHNSFTIEFPAKYQGNFNTQIIDLLGRKYEIGKNNLKSGGSNVHYDISKLNLTPGVYFLRINSDNKKTEMMKVIVN